MNRRAFTLVELMIVIAIIAILTAILLPAIGAVMARAHFAQVKTEISGLETAIASFESKFGMIPPSYIEFTKTASNELPAATQAILRSMFPKIELNADPADGPTPIVADLKNAGLWGEILHGPEALVFFLGGIADNRGGTWEMQGFSMNPARPFQPSASSGTRIGPFFEFQTSRIRPHGPYVAYFDPLDGARNPYIYVSTARTNTYVPTDTTFSYEYKDESGSQVITPWRPYQKSEGSYFNPTGYQIISPGPDERYGHGGWMAASQDSPVSDPPEPKFSKAPDRHDEDNITNFGPVVED